MTDKSPAPSRLFSRRLTLLAAAPLMLAGLFVLGVASAHAATASRGDSETQVITLHAIHAPDTPAQARQLYRRLDRAAIDVCGGGDGSLPDTIRAIRAAACWRTAMGRAIAQVGSPLLTLAMAGSAMGPSPRWP